MKHTIANHGLRDGALLVYHALRHGEAARALAYLEEAERQLDAAVESGGQAQLLEQAYWLWIAGEYANHEGGPEALGEERVRRAQDVVAAIADGWETPAQHWLYPERSGVFLSHLAICHGALQAIANHYPLLGAQRAAKTLREQAFAAFMRGTRFVSERGGDEVWPDIVAAAVPFGMISAGDLALVQAVEALEGQPLQPQEAGLLAWYWMESGRPARAAQLLDAQGGASEAGSRPDTALEDAPGLDAGGAARSDREQVEGPDETAVGMPGRAVGDGAQAEVPETASVHATDGGAMRAQEETPPALLRIAHLLRARGTAQTRGAVPAAGAVFDHEPLGGESPYFAGPNERTPRLVTAGVAPTVEVRVAPHDPARPVWLEAETGTGRSYRVPLQPISDPELGERWRGELEACADWTQVRYRFVRPAEEAGEGDARAAQGELGAYADHGRYGAYGDYGQYGAYGDYGEHGERGARNAHGGGATSPWYRYEVLRWRPPGDVLRVTQGAGAVTAELAPVAPGGPALELELTENAAGGVRCRVRLGSGDEAERARRAGEAANVHACGIAPGSGEAPGGDEPGAGGLATDGMAAGAGEATGAQEPGAGGLATDSMAAGSLRAQGDMAAPDDAAVPGAGARAAASSDGSSPVAADGVYAVGAARLAVADGRLRLTLTDGEGETLAASAGNRESNAAEGASAPLEALVDRTGRIYKLRLNFVRRQGERFYGMGERFSGLAHDGREVDNYVFNQYKDQGSRTYMPVPWALSSAGYGLFLDTAMYSMFRFGAGERPGLLQVEADLHAAEQQLDWHWLSGRPAELVQAFATLTGKPKLPPKWALGPWMSSNNWDSEREVDWQLEQTRRHRIPATVIVLEQWSDESTFYIFNDAIYARKPGSARFTLADFTFPEWGRWPDPRAMMRRLHDAGLRVLLWQAPVMKDMDGIAHAQRDEDEREMAARGYGVEDADGGPYRIPSYEWFRGSLVPDFTSPQASEWWLDKRRYLLEELGIDGFKTDGGECIYGAAARFADGRDGTQMRNLYPNVYVGAFQAYADRYVDGGSITFSRAGYTGAQTVPLHWAGDEKSTFAAFRASIVAGLSSGLSGIPFWGWDLGGFSGEIPTAELYIRSTAMAALCPVMQYHAESKGEFNLDRTPWNIAERTGAPEVLTLYKRYADLRMNLLPYLYAEAQRSAATGLPLMRAMLLDYPDDPRCAALEQQYLLGEALLVAPVTEEGATAVDVYLPEGEWLPLVDEAAGMRFAGGGDEAGDEAAPAAEVAAPAQALAAAEVVDAAGTDRAIGIAAEAEGASAPAAAEGGGSEAAVNGVEAAANAAEGEGAGWPRTAGGMAARPEAEPSRPEGARPEGVAAAGSNPASSILAAAAQAADPASRVAGDTEARSAREAGRRPGASPIGRRADAPPLIGAYGSEPVAAGRTVRVKAPLGTIPAFLRADCALPLNLGADAMLADDVGNAVDGYERLSVMLHLQRRIDFAYADEAAGVRVTLTAERTAAGVTAQAVVSGAPATLIFRACGSRSTTLAHAAGPVAGPTTAPEGEPGIRWQVRGRDLLAELPEGTHTIRIAP
ncbi:hypothetical protein IDH44_00980 [Paenibacillus sp. IB182496]|uniref:Glycoside hydrolase family 31 N-terminal domain-containing protein n=1 Tax=Paenibacillus sabuli TaxID=2772509 RepID=A0A927GPR4_9BACL|nr:TIM-barrel domain-containing protein [Paenibacillus sabuli]MBD2843749.1 hypothetical protein [Paenibacillus sabuli]